MNDFVKKNGLLTRIEDGFEYVVICDDHTPPPGDGWQYVDRPIDPDDDNEHTHHTWKRRLVLS